MKLRFAFLGLLSLIAVSCSYEETFVPEDNNDYSTEFYATIDEQPDADTKVYADDQLRVLWNADDRITIFNKNTYNQQYRFTGVDGDNAGGFRIVKSDDEFITSNPLDNTYAVYPYRETNKISNDGVVTTSIPSEQTYKANSFGIGANTMVSVAESNMLKFKNVGGYLSLKFYGEGVSVSSITLKSNNGELIAGDCTVDMSSGLPESNLLTTNVSDAITMVCDPPIELPAEKDDAVMTIFVLSPGTLTGGFTVTVNTADGGVFEKSTGNKLEIGRSAITRLGALEVVPEYVQPNNVIYYTSTDGEIVTPNNPDAFDASIISNEYVDGQGVITFDGEVTSIGEHAFTSDRMTSILIPNSVSSIGFMAFALCSFTSITIPASVTNIGLHAFPSHSLETIIVDVDNSIFDSRNDCNAIINTSSNTLILGCAKTVIPGSVTKIGAQAFASCDDLTNIIIPPSVTSIGEYAFVSCHNLYSISISESVTSIGRCAFQFCFSLTDINIPESVYTIGVGAFMNCYSLTSVTIPQKVNRINNSTFWECTKLATIIIPESVTTIDAMAFYNCSSLTSIAIPESVTSIGASSFAKCSGLTEINIPESVTSIGGGIFGGCGSLESVIIPNTVTSIGDNAFYRCSSLTSISIPESVASIGESAFYGCCSLDSIICMANIPPSGIDSTTFDNTNGCGIYVPVGSVNSYKTAEGWNNYADRIQAISSTNEINGHAYVDMGNGLKWATMNVGASSEIDYGDYYAWAETETKSVYSWTTYKYMQNSQSSWQYLTRYTFDDKQYSGIWYNESEEFIGDGKTVFSDYGFVDDAARTNWSSTWRTPTNEEWNWLLDTNNCTRVWIENYNDSGKSGWLFTSTFNGNFLFLPAAGFRYLSDYYDSGSSGYWSSSLGKWESQSASAILFDYNTVYNAYTSRETGLPIRPVSD